MPVAATSAGINLSNISGVLVGGISTAPSAVSLAGFDAVTQFSRRLMQSQLEQSLGRAGLMASSAMVPWGSVPVPASVMAAIPQALRLTLSARPAYLEVLLTEPSLGVFTWPDIILTNPGGGVATTAAVVGIQRPTVDLTWQVQINLFFANSVLNQAAPAVVKAPGPGAVSSGGAAQGVVGASDPSGSRTTLATGTVTSSAFAVVSVLASLWCFGVNLDFSSLTAPAASSTGAISDFFGTDTGKDLLAQAFAPMTHAGAVQLTPEVAPAGALSSRTVTSAGLPTLSVQDILLQDAKGSPILALCVHLGGGTGGVASLVQSFLSGQDFAYGASTTVLAPALMVRWSIAAAGLTLVGNVPVDVPPNANSSQGFTGTAQVQTTISTALNDVSIKPSSDNQGDAVRLLSTQVSQLLNLWDQNGKSVGDLGTLAQPQTQPLVVPVCLFDSTAQSPSSLQQSFLDFLVQVIGVLMFPLLNTFPVDANSISGFASSAMQTFVVRWGLPSTLVVNDPNSGLLEQ
jgi:hypothetical protein